MMKQVLIAATTLATLAACSGPTPGADIVLSYSEAEQVDALRQCQNDQGGSAQLTYDVLKLSDGRVSVFAVNGGDVSLAQARSLNQCMQARLIAQGGNRIAVQPVTNSVQTPRSVTHTTCPPNYTGMFRGSQYCVNGAFAG